MKNNVGMKMEIKVVEIVENEEDGSATVILEMDKNTLLSFAKKGIISCLTEFANSVE